MKNNKFISILMILSLIFSLLITGCSSSENATDNNTDKTNITDNTTNSTEANSHTNKTPKLPVETDSTPPVS